MFRMMSEDEIETWYEEARQELDKWYQEKLEQDLHNEQAREKYGSDLKALKLRYDRLYRKLHANEDWQRRIHASKPARAWRWFIGLPGRVRERLRRDKVE